MAEPACLAISSRKARNGSQRISKRNPASSHHRDRVHRLAPRPTRGIGFNGGTRATKKRPACARRSASVALFGAHSDDYMPECDDRSSHRSNQLVNGGRPTSGRCGIRSIRSPEGHRPARPPPAPRAASSLGTSGRLARMCRAGPRAGSVSHRNRPVGNGHERSQAASETAGHSAHGRPTSGGGGRRSRVRVSPPPRQPRVRGPCQRGRLLPGGGLADLRHPVNPEQDCGSWSVARWATKPSIDLQAE
jgi:hypothetical protein